MNIYYTISQHEKFPWNGGNNCRKLTLLLCWFLQLQLRQSFFKHFVLWQPLPLSSQIMKATKGTWSKESEVLFRKAMYNYFYYMTVCCLTPHAPSIFQFFVPVVADVCLRSEVTGTNANSCIPSWGSCGIFTILVDAHSFSLLLVAS